MKSKLWSTLQRCSISPKNLRICAILIGIYQVLVSSFVLFLVLLGLSHAEEMDTLLRADIAQQEEEVEIHEDGINEFRFKTATDLASTTLIVMYTASAISAIYALSCFCLMFGIMRNRSELLLPWLIVDMVGVLLTMDLMLLFSHGCSVVSMMGGITNYWILCGAILTFDIFTWFIVHSYYLISCRIKKLTESAVIPIPCPAAPYYYQSPSYTDKDAMLVGGVSSPA